MLKDRLKDIDQWVNSNYISENKHLLKLKKKEEKWRKKYTEELENYVFIPTKKDLEKYVKIGGYIRYINLNNELKWGGILLRVYQDKNNWKLFLKNTSNKKWNITWDNNYIFYREHRTSSDKLKELFLSIAGI